MKVDETCSWSRAGLPVKPIRPRPKTSKPILEPMSRKSATLPKRWWPKWKSSPTTTSLAPRHPTSTSATNSSADSKARTSSNGTTTVRSTPVVASCSNFCSLSVSKSGADSGRTTVAGCRSKVTTAEANSLSLARRRTSATTCRWPTCTPS